MSEVQIWESEITSNKSILRDGLMIISTCKKETVDIWQAHFGAAAIGSYFFVRSNNLSQELAQLINSQAESMVKKILGTNSIQHLSGCDEPTDALNILFDLGHVSFFKRGLPPVMKLIKVLRNSHNVRQADSIKLISPVDHLPLQPAVRAKVLPTDIKFWEKNYSDQDWEYGHIFKFPHSFYDHLLRVDHKKESYIENFRYIIG